MTPEQKATAVELAKVMEANRQISFAEVEKNEGREALTELEKMLEESAESTRSQMLGRFDVQPSDHPLLAMAMVQMIGSNLAHVLDEHGDMSAEEQLEHLKPLLMGGLEAVMHLAVRAVLQENAG